MRCQRRPRSLLTETGEVRIARAHSVGQQDLGVQALGPNDEKLSFGITERPGGNLEVLSRRCGNGEGTNHRQDNHHDRKRNLPPSTVTVRAH